jgi:phosphatidylglycerol:prolipoprotein diacylglycerol transferase
MIHWNVSPEIFTLGPLQPRWYGVLFATAFLGGFQLLKQFSLREKVPLKHLDSMLYHMAFGTIVGARLGHCLFYEPDVYLRDPIRILFIWEGGLASHGAFIGIILALWRFSRKSGLAYSWVVDRCAIGVALAGFFIRTGNLFNSEILGKPASLPWSFVFVRVDQVPRHPTQIYEALSYLCIFGVLYWMYWRTEARKRPYRLFGSMLAMTFTARFFLEFFKENQVAFESSLPLNMGQLLSIPVVLTGLVLVWCSGRRSESPRKR